MTDARHLISMHSYFNPSNVFLKSTTVKRRRTAWRTVRLPISGRGAGKHSAFLFFSRSHERDAAVTLTRTVWEDIKKDEEDESCVCV